MLHSRRFCIPLLLALCSGLSVPMSARAAPPSGRFYFGAGNNDYNSVIFESNRDASNTVALTGYQNGLHSQYPSVSRDGSLIAFSSNQTGDRDEHIWVMNSDGSHRRQLTFDDLIEHNYDRDMYPAISPDGRKIAFTSNRTPELIRPNYYPYIDHPRELYVINTDGTGSTQLTVSDGNLGSNTLQQVAWGPDSKTIMFTGYIPYTDANGYGIRQGVYTIQSGGGGLQQIVGGFSNYYNITAGLDWSHDGRYVLYTTAQTGQNPLVHVYDLQANAETGFAQPSFSSSPGDIRFSPDGSQLAFSRYYEYDLLFTDRAGNVLNALPEGNFFTNYTAWNLNGDGFWWQDAVPVAAPASLTLTSATVYANLGQVVPVVPILKDAAGNILAQVAFSGSVSAIGGWSGYSANPDYDPIFFALSPYENRVQNNGITSGPYQFTTNNGGLTVNQTIIWGQPHVELQLVSTVRFGDGSVRVTVQPYDSGNARVTNLSLSGVSLNGANYTYTNRTFYSDMGPGDSGVPGQSIFDFAPGVLLPGRTGLLKITGTYVGGTYASSLRVTIP